MNQLPELTSQNARSTAVVEDRDLNLLSPPEVRDMLEDSAEAPLWSVGQLPHHNVEFINNFVFASVEDEVEEEYEDDDEELEDDEEYEEVDEESGEEDAD